MCAWYFTTIFCWLIYLQHNLFFLGINMTIASLIWTDYKRFRLLCSDCLYCQG